MRTNNLTRIEPTLEAEEGWNKLVQEKFSALLWGQCTKALTPDREVAQAPLFAGGVAEYNRICQESANSGYAGFVLSAK